MRTQLTDALRQIVDRSATGEVTAMLWRTAPHPGGRSGWSRRLHQLLAGGMVAVLTSSCATNALWKATNPQEYVAVPQSEVSESELQERGVDYRRDDTQGVYYVEKTHLRRLGDYSVRFFAAPATVILDTATVIVVVGGVVAVSSGWNGRWNRHW